MVSCILLSAGLSQRFGSPKALAAWQHQPLLEFMQQQLIQTDVLEIIIVLGAHQDLLLPHIIDHEKIKTVFNSRFALGQTSSFKAGLRLVSGAATGIMLLPVDYPNIQKVTFNMLIKAFMNNDSKIIIPTVGQRKGHPPIFSKDLKPDFLNLPEDQGLNTIARQYSQDVSLIEVEDKGIRETFNTPEELEALKGLYGY